MKKLLSLLSVLTISGTAVPTTIAASPYEKKDIKLENIEINHQQTNNLEKLNRVKRSSIINSEGINPSGRTIDTITNEYRFLAHNRLILQIDKFDLEDIFFFVDIHPNNNDALFNKIFKMINEFKKVNHSADNKSEDYISNNDISIMTDVIINHLEEIRNTFNKNTNRGLIIRTNRSSYWKSNDNYWGVNTE